MKSKIIFTLFLLPFFLFLFSKEIYGCGSYETCPYNIVNNCSKPECADCTWCLHLPTSSPTGAVEDVTGKITNPILSDRLKTMPGDIFLNNFLRTGISFLLLIGSVIFFFVLLAGAVKWLSSSGDKTKLEGAQKQISSGLVGLAILLSTFVIMKLIETLFGVSLLQFTLPTL